MSKSVDDKVVSMKFDNSSFESKVRSTINLLDALKRTLNFSSSKKGLDDLQGSANRFSMASMGASVDGISAKFLALGTVAATAIATLTNKVVNAGLQLSKALTVDPITTGLSEYETNLKSIQTILANTKASGADLDDVNAALLELNEYSDKTIYNFSEMARNIGTFTAAGVDLERSTASIKGIANLAAISGSTSEQASTAMYQLSQAIAAGRVSLQDWNSVVNAGMGGAVFQRALAETAVALGTIDKNSVKLSGSMKNVTVNGKSFRESIMTRPGQESWLTSDVLTTTLSTFTGDLKDAELAALGFNEAQIKSIQATAKSAVAAATEVKTLTGVYDTAKEVAGSGWAQTWQIIFGDFEEAKKTFTGMSNVINTIISSSADARNKLLGDWKDLGGRTALIDTVKNVFQALVSVIKPIRDAFREIFPATTGKQLFEITEAIRDFTANLKIGGKTSENLKRTFAGLFAVLDIGWEIFKGLIGVVAGLFGAVTDGSGGFLEFTGNIGDFLVKLRDAVVQGDGLKNFFEGLGNILEKPILLIRKIGGALANLWDGLGNTDEVSDSFGRVTERLNPLSRILEKAGGAWAAMGRAIQKVQDVIEPFIENVSESMSELGTSIAEGLNSGSFDKVLDTLNTGIFAGILLALRKFVSNGFSLDIGDGLLSNMSGAFDQLTGTLSAMQSQIQAKTLLLIASAVALLAASMVALSLIDSDKLKKALTAMGVAFAQLLAAMAILVKISGAAGFVKVPLIAGAMILLAGAVLVLTAAVRSLSGLSWEELGKGLAGVAGLLAVISLAAIPLSANSAGLVRAGLGMIGISIAIKILASAVEDFADLDWKDIGKGLSGVAGALAVVIAAMSLMPANMAINSLGLIAVGVALKIIGSAVKDMSDLGWEEIGRGMTVLASSMLILGLALYGMTGALSGAAALIVAAYALKILAPALEKMSELSWDEIARGMTALGGALLALTVGLNLMVGALPGAAALVVAATALRILTPVLTTLGDLSWEEIGKGLGALAAALLILGVAGVALTPVIPSLIGLGLAITLIGAGLALAGAGILAFAAALGILTIVGGAAAGAITAILTAIIKLIPVAMEKFGEGLIAFAEAIAKGGPAFTGAFVAVLESLIKATVRVAPQINAAMNKLLDLLLSTLVNSVPKLQTAGFNILLALLRGIANNIGKIVKVAADIAAAFLRALGQESGRIADAGAKMVIDTVNGVARAIRENQGAMNAAGRNLGSAIVEGMVSGLISSGGAVASAAAGVARSAYDAGKRALGINSPSKEFMKLGVWSDEGFAAGFVKGSRGVTKSAEGVAEEALTAMQSTMSRISDAVAMDVDTDPVITPVVDLSQFRKEAAFMNGLFSAPLVLPRVSYGQASQISSESLKTSAEQAQPDSTVHNNFTYQQNNYSPESLKTADIYRQTRNQIGQVKRALGVA